MCQSQNNLCLWTLADRCVPLAHPRVVLRAEGLEAEGLALGLQRRLQAVVRRRRVRAGRVECLCAARLAALNARACMSATHAQRTSASAGVVSVRESRVGGRTVIIVVAHRALQPSALAADSIQTLDGLHPGL